VDHATSYTLVSGDSATTQNFTGAAITATLPATLPSLSWKGLIMNYSTTNTLALSTTLTVNGTTSLTALPACTTRASGCATYIFEAASDGVNYVMRQAGANGAAGAAGATGSAGPTGATGATGSAGAGGGAYSSTWANQATTCNTAHIFCWLTDGAGINSQTDDGSTFIYQAFGMPVTPPGLIASWTSVNSPTLTQKGPGIVITKATTGAAGFVGAIPAGSGQGQTTGTWTVTMMFTSASFTNYQSPGMCITNGTVAGTSNAYCLDAVTPQPGSVTNPAALNQAAGSPNWLSYYRFPINAGPLGTGTPSATVVMPTCAMTGIRAQKRTTGGSGAALTVDWSIGCGNLGADLDWVDVGQVASIAFVPTHYGPFLDPRTSSPASMHVYHLGLE
jgi:hypothetical protein